MDVLAAGVAITAGLAEGPAGNRAPDALHRLGTLIGATSAGLVGPAGPETGPARQEPAIAWWGPGREDGVGLAARAAASGRRASDRDRVALPLRVAGAPGGVLVLGGPVSSGTARRAAAWVADALERAHLQTGAAEADRARLRTLRAEISPHFVYNALTTIASFVRSDPARARDLLQSFAEFIRGSLAARDDYTTVAGEFRSVEAYLTLARAVLGDRLTVQVRVAPEVLPVPIPVLALQPLVENAVQHGVERAEGGGTVLVSGEAEGGVCVIAVEDDGPGMAPEHARAVLAGTAEGAGLALVNVDRRLRAVYGTGHGLVVETAEGAGTRIVLRVPRFQPGVVVG
ncbi:MAG: histidine kinase [Pseudonocardia sp.]|nr:histidine kinase [Pseudonocardia sp.]